MYPMQICPVLLDLTLSFLLLVGPFTHRARRYITDSYFSSPPCRPLLCKAPYQYPYHNHVPVHAVLCIVLHIELG
ncbi:hypothetical protein BGZ63DRAFT_375722, partial [Mariannaea sp. PMI_226]